MRKIISILRTPISRSNFAADIYAPVWQQFRAEHHPSPGALDLRRIRCLVHRWVPRFFESPSGVSKTNTGVTCFVVVVLPLTMESARTRCTGGRFNLNFLAPTYGSAFLNPWNMSKYPIMSLNSKIDFRALKRAIFLSFLD